MHQLLIPSKKWVPNTSPPKKKLFFKIICSLDSRWDVMLVPFQGNVHWEISSKISRITGIPSPRLGSDALQECFGLELRASGRKLWVQSFRCNDDRYEDMIQWCINSCMYYSRLIWLLMSLLSLPCIMNHYRHINYNCCYHYPDETVFIMIYHINHI